MGRHLTFILLTYTIRPVIFMINNPWHMKPRLFLLALLVIISNLLQAQVKKTEVVRPVNLTKLQANTNQTKAATGNTGSSSSTSAPAVSMSVQQAYNWWKYINPTGVNYVGSFSNVGSVNFDTGVVAFSKRTALSLVGWINHNVNFQTAESDDSLVHLEPLVYMEQLEVPWQTGDAGLQHIRNMKSLKLFAYAISGTPCPNVTDNGMATLATLTNLQTLSLNYCTKVTDQGLKSLCSLPNLQSLILTFAAITDNGMSSLKSLTKLQTLSFAKCAGLTDNGVDALITSIKAMPGFQKLIISGTGITATGRGKLSAAGISFVY